MNTNALADRFLLLAYVAAMGILFSIAVRDLDRIANDLDVLAAPPVVGHP
jgi:hypothetical protein